MITQENIPYTADEIKAMVKTCEKYNKALEKARELMDKGYDVLMPEIFPELKESEDEKIRKEIIDFIKSRGGFKGDWIAWLEKQKNKKLNVDLLTNVLRKHLYTCVNKTNTYVRSEEDHISLSELINKIRADLIID